MELVADGLESEFADWFGFGSVENWLATRPAEPNQQVEEDRDKCLGLEMTRKVDPHSFHLRADIWGLDHIPKGRIMR